MLHGRYALSQNATPYLEIKAHLPTCVLREWQCRVAPVDHDAAFSHQTPRCCTRIQQEVLTPRSLEPPRAPSPTTQTPAHRLPRSPTAAARRPSRSPTAAARRPSQTPATASRYRRNHQLRPLSARRNRSCNRSPPASVAKNSRSQKFLEPPAARDDLD
jgi:hypothetical protein